MKKGMQLSVIALSVVVISVGSLACRRKNQGTATADAIVPAVDDKTAVCMYEGLGVRESVGKNAKYLSSLTLGETVKWSGATDKDETGKEYVKVELSDGKSGWVSVSGIATDAKIAAIKEDSVTYKRPDLVTASNQKLPMMTVVAITQQKDSWFQIVGESKKALGWVRKDSVTLDKDDVTVAILATKKLREKDDLDPAKKLEAIIQAAPNPNSFFVQKLKEKALPAAPAAQAKPEDSSWTESQNVP